MRRRGDGAVRTWVAIAIVAAFIVPPLRGLYVATGGTMEEGFMLYFPMRMWEGDVPNVDFLHLYGPGALHVLMLWYKLLGSSLAAERTFGLLQHLGIIFGLFALARPWGRKAATLVGVIAVFFVLTPIGLTAMAWNGGLALTLIASVLALRAHHARSAAMARRCLAGAGLLAALALTYRPDLLLAVGGVLAWLLCTWRQRADVERRTAIAAVAAGGAVGLLPLWVHLGMAGIPASWRGMVLDPVFHLRGGRELPVPPSWDYLDGALQRIAESVPPWYPLPHVAAEQAIFLWFFAMLAVAIGLLTFAWWLRRRIADGRSAALLVVAIVSVGILPQGLQRPDSTHLTWVTCVSWPFLVVAAAEVGRRRRPARSMRVGLAWGTAVTLALTLSLTALFTVRYYLLHTRVSLGRVVAPFLVERRGPRPDGVDGTYEFRFGAWNAAQASQAVVDDLAVWSRPGQRLFVGPMDLRRTWYSDVIFYWMLPELEPATYYIEMDPGLANAPGGGLADELRTADWVILTAFWAGWNEPNSSMDFGDARPNQVIRDEFCLFEEYEGGLVRLYRKC